MSCKSLHIAKSAVGECGQQQTVNHIVNNMCPLTNVEGGLQSLRDVDDSTLVWLAGNHSDLTTL